jgi:hypothetical protein
MNTTFGGLEAKKEFIGVVERRLRDKLPESISFLPR